MIIIQNKITLLLIRVYQGALFSVTFSIILIALRYVLIIPSVIKDCFECLICKLKILYDTINAEFIISSFRKYL